MLSKEMRFKALMEAGTAGTLAGGCVGIACASADAGIWSLPALTLTTTATSAIVLWLKAKWHPLFHFDVHRFLSLYRFGGYLLVSNIIDTAFTRLYAIVLGKLHNPETVGLYHRADTLQQLPSQAISQLVNRVSFPLFSSLQHDKGKLQRELLNAIEILMFLNTPAMLGLAASSPNIITVLFGSDWQGAASICRILCFAGLIYPLHAINLTILNAQGYSHIFLRLELIKKSLGLATLTCGAFLGVHGIAFSAVVLSCLGLLINTYYTKRFLGIGAVGQVKHIFHILIAGIMLFFLVSFAGNLTNSPFLGLVSQMAAGICTWAVFAGLLMWIGRLPGIKRAGL